MNIAEWLVRTAIADATRPALFLGQTPVATYGDVLHRALCLGRAFRDRGVGPGDRIALVMKNTPDYLLAMYGAWALGAAVLPINAKLHSREIAGIIEDADASLVIASPEIAHGLDVRAGTTIIATGGDEWTTCLEATPLDAVAYRAPGDLAWLFYTSGTTGRPKGVIITHRMLMTMSQCYQTDCDLVRSGDAAIYAAPFSHGAGLYNAMHVRAGARHVFPESGGYDPDEVLALAAFHGGAHLFMAPTMVQRLTRNARSAGQRGDGLRTIVYAGGPMYNADIIEAVDHFGPIFVQIYGQGECPMGITALSREDIADRRGTGWQNRLGSVGRAQSAVEVRISGALKPGDLGEIEVRGDTVMPGYWNNPDATAKTIVDGWLRTGDVGSMDMAGYVTLKDRSKDLIISGGSNIYPREVEEVLLTHPAIAEVAVVGRPHAEWGEEVVAFVVVADGADPGDDAFDQHCLSQIARFKRPKVYVRVPDLPKNNYGKVLKTSLRSVAAATDRASSG